MSHQKNSKAPGDNVAMVKGRREFLRAGHYQAFANAITALLKECPLANRNMALLDAGCGEGFYTEQIQKTFNSHHIYGLDISKPAITAAASDKNIEWCVASSNCPPFIEASFDVIISVFSRIERDAFLRLLKSKGYILYAGPGDNHLHALRSIIYDEVNHYSTEKHHEYFGDDFTLVKTVTLQVPIQLNKHSQIMQLLSMTPHAHRISSAGRIRLAQTTCLRDTGDFKLYLYQKK
jgi:23S rRNA (guanine745-N1)-methyltransferase